MSTNIDKRIVKMSFDNASFEKSAKNTMSTLDKLKDKLSFKNVKIDTSVIDSIKEKLSFKNIDMGTNSINSAIKSVNFAPIHTALNSLSASVNGWKIAAVTAISEVTKKALNAGSTLVKSLTIDPVMSGFSEYETQLNAVQTILANTKDKGETIDTVNAALDELNTYADETIYNFTQMANNIGTFTAAGVGLEDSVKAIKGIANLAAISGSNSTQASTAMYQLSQALAAGKVSLQDWNSVVNAGMGGANFQNTIIETAEEMGISAREYVESAGSFREAISGSGSTPTWFTSDVLIAALQKYTDTTTELGRTATDAATKVKTISQLMDTINEEVGSGWTQSWEYILGDFEEAKELLTGVYLQIQGIISPIINARNEVLKFWHDNGGRTAIIEGIAAAFENLKKVVTPISAAFKNLIPSVTGQQLVDLSVRFSNFMKSISVSEETMTSIRNIASGVFSVIAYGLSLVKDIASVTVSFFRNFTGSSGPVLKAIGNIATKVQHLFTALKNSDTFKNVLSNIFSSGLSQALSSSIGLIGKIISNIVLLISKLNIFKVAGSGASKAVEVLSSIFGTIATVIANVNTAILELVNWLLDLANASTDAGDDINLLGSIFTSFKNKLDKLGSAINDVISGIAGFDVFKKISSSIKSLIKKFQQFKTIVTEIYYQVVNENPGEPKIVSIFRTAWIVLKRICSNLTKTFKSLDLKSIGSGLTTVGGAFKTLGTIIGGGVLGLLSLAADGFSKIASAVTDIDFSDLGSKIIDGLTKAKDAVVTKIKEIWSAIKGAFSSNKEMSKNPIEGIVDMFSTSPLDALKELFTSIVQLASGIIKTITGLFDDVNLDSILNIFSTGGLTYLEVGVGSFFKTMGDSNKSMSDLVDSFKSFGQTGDHINKFIDGLGDSLANFGKKTDTKSDLLKSIAIAIATLAASLLVLSLLPAEDLQNSLTVISTVFTELIAAMILLSKYTTMNAAQTTSKGDFFSSTSTSMTGLAEILVAMGAAVLLMSISLAKLAKLDPEGLKNSVTGLTAIMTEMTAMMILVSKYGGAADGSAKAIKAIGTSLLTMSTAMWILGSMDKASLIKGGIAIILLGGIIAALMALANHYKDLKAGSILALSAVVLSAAIAIVLISVALIPMVLAISALAAVIMLVGVDNVVLSLIALIAMVGAFALIISDLANDGDLKQAASVLAVASALVLASLALIPVAAAIALLAACFEVMDLSSMLLAVGILMGVMVIFAAIMYLLAPVAPMALVVSAALLVCSVAFAVLAIGLLLLIPVIEYFSSVNTGSIAQFGVNFMIAMTLLAAGCALAAVPVALLAAGLLILAVAVVVLGVGLEAIGTGLLLISAGATALSAVDFTVLANNIVDALTAFAARASEIAGSLVEIFIQIIVELTTKIPQLVDSILVFVLELLYAINEHIDEIAAVLIEILLGIVWGALEGMANYFNENAENIGKIIGNLIEGSLKVIVSTIKELIMSLIDFGKWLGEIFDFGDGSWLSDAWDAVSGTISGIFEGIGSFFSDAFTSIGNGISAAWDAVAGTVKKVFKKVKSALGFDESEHATAKSGESNNFFDNFIDAANIAKDTISSFTGFAKEYREVGEDEYQKLGEDIMQAFVDGFKEYYDLHAKQTLKSTASNMLSYSKSTAWPISDWKEVGEQIMAGIKTGIESGTADVNGAVVSIANSALVSAKSELGIQSPSREFAEVGKYMMLGMSAGIEENAKAVNDSTYSTINDTINQALDAASDISDDTLSPTISPVVDLSNVTSASNSIDNVFSNQALQLNGISGQLSSNISANMEDYIPNDDTELLIAIQTLHDDLGILNDSMSSMQIIMDSGQLVGSISGKLNTSLGRATTLGRRGWT